MHGIKYSGPEPRVRSETFRVSFWHVLAGWLALRCWRAVWWLARQLVTWLTVTALVAGVWLHGLFGMLGVSLAAAGLVAALVSWRLLHAGSFRRVVAWPVIAWCRRYFVYGREWPQLMATLNLSKTFRGKDMIPELGRVKRTGTVERVRVRTLAGHVLADYASNADRFAACFGAVDCRVRSVKRRLSGKVTQRVLDLWFLVTDPLVAPVPLFEVPASPNLKKLPVALREDSLTWPLRLLGTHVLIAGVTGSGKGSVLWSLVRSLGNAVASRLVEVWAIDPKGGMELASGQPLFARYCYGDEDTDDQGNKRVYEESYAETLEAAVEQMRDRQARLRGRTRLHTPTPDEPLIVVLVDELASLTAYVTDRKVRDRIKAALQLLLSQGRACGVVVVAALQDPRKDVLPERGLFPTRIALRVSEPEEADLVLGKGMRDNGARCDEISPDTPGVGYVAVDGQPEPVRVRFAFVDDAEIAGTAHTYAPGSTGGLHALPGLDEQEPGDEGREAS